MSAEHSQRWQRRETQHTPSPAFVDKVLARIDFGLCWEYGGSLAYGYGTLCVNPDHLEPAMPPPPSTRARPIASGVTSWRAKTSASEPTGVGRAERAGEQTTGRGGRRNG